MTPAVHIRSILDKTIPIYNKEKISTADVDQLYREIDTGIAGLVGYVESLIGDPWGFAEYLPENSKGTSLYNKLGQALGYYENNQVTDERKQILNVIQRLFQLPLRDIKPPFDFQDQNDYVQSKDINPQLAFITRAALFQATRDAMAKVYEDAVGEDHYDFLPVHDYISDANDDDLLDDDSPVDNDGKIDPSALAHDLGLSIYTSQESSIYDFLFDSIANSENSADKEKDLLLLTGFPTVPEKYTDSLVEMFKDSFSQSSDSYENHNLRLVARILSKVNHVDYDSVLVEYCNTLLSSEHSLEEDEHGHEVNISTALYALMNMQLDEEKFEEQQGLFDHLIELIQDDSSEKLKFIPYATFILSRSKSFSDQQLDAICDLLGATTPLTHPSAKAILANYLRQADPEKREILENKLFDKLLDPGLNSDLFYEILHLISLSPTKDVFSTRLETLKNVANDNELKNIYIAALVARYSGNRERIDEIACIAEDCLASEAGAETDESSQIFAFRLFDLLGPQYVSKLIQPINQESSPIKLDAYMAIDARASEYKTYLLELLGANKDQEFIPYMFNKRITPLNLLLRQTVNLSSSDDQYQQAYEFISTLVGAADPEDKRKTFAETLIETYPKLNLETQGFMSQIFSTSIDTDVFVKNTALTSTDARYKLAEYLLRQQGYTPPCTSI